VGEGKLAALTKKIEKNPINSEGYVARADWYACRGMWRESASDLLRAVALNPRERNLWVRAGGTLILADDARAHRELCERMVVQFNSMITDAEAESTCKMCLLLPQSIDASRLPIKPLEDWLDRNKSDTSWGWGYATCALASYRAGDARQAAIWAVKSRESSPASDPAKALALDILSLAQHQMNQVDDARKSLADATRLIPTELRTLGSSDYQGSLPVSVLSIHHDWLVAEILRREASAVISGAPDPPTSSIKDKTR
jgi:tetratricopeptide (TPR) repeat protein